MRCACNLSALLLVINIIIEGANAQQPQQTLRIPRILHHIFLSGSEAYEAETRKPGASLKAAWQTSCLAAYPGWKHMFWTQDDALAHIRQHYPWFEATYASFDHFVLRGDALRYLVLHSMGGVYLDLDIECFPNASLASHNALAGYDVVLQGHHQVEPVINAMMASVPQHPIFEHTLQEIVARGTPEAMERIPDVNIRILYTVGPRMFGDVVSRYIEGGPGVPYGDLVARPHNVSGSIVRVYDVGAWYQPCTWDDCACHKRLALAEHMGHAPAGVVGVHHFTSTWAAEMGRDHRRCRMHQIAYVRSKVRGMETW